MMEEFVEMHVKNDPMYSSCYFQAMLQVSFTKAPVCGHAEEMSFYEQPTQSLEKTESGGLMEYLYIHLFSHPQQVL